MRILICGSRRWGEGRSEAYKYWDSLSPEEAEETAVFQIVKTFGPHDILIHGGAPGADTMAEESWLVDFSLPPERVLKFPAQWNRFGRSAGFVRNQQMLDEGQPDVVIWFGDADDEGDPTTPGTRHMVEISRKAGVHVVHWLQWYYDSWSHLSII